MTKKSFKTAGLVIFNSPMRGRQYIREASSVALEFSLSEIGLCESDTGVQARCECLSIARLRGGEP
jgi:hypothetical protein